MEFVGYSKEYLNQIVDLWNESVVPVSIFKPFSASYFEQKFVSNPFFDPEGFKILLNGDQVIGYGHALVNQNENAPGFISLIAVDRAYQRQGYGTKILHECESYLQNKKNKKIVRLYFASPINLEWIIPKTNADHPGAPAVLFNSPFYFLLMNNGYETNGQLDGYHLDITNYELPQKVVIKEEENAKSGYTICLYDPTKHHGFAELFDALKNPGWHQAVQDNLSKENPAPMLIVQKDGEILGWTGPMYTQESGRGYFAGIGVHPKTQGLGLGKALFCHLCHESKKNKASFMTLFTGADNPARNIYLYAGFHLVQSFAILKKELRS